MPVETVETEDNVKDVKESLSNLLLFGTASLEKAVSTVNQNIHTVFLPSRMKDCELGYCEEYN